MTPDYLFRMYGSVSNLRTQPMIDAKISTGIETKKFFNFLVFVTVTCLMLPINSRLNQSHPFMATFFYPNLMLSGLLILCE